MAQLVDPFVPARPRQIQLKRRPLPQPVKRAGQGRVGNDIVNPAVQASLPPRAPVIVAENRQPTANTTRQVPHRIQRHVEAHPPARPRREHKWRHYVKLSLACLAMLAIGSLAQVAIAGEIAIGIYAIWAVITKIPSRTTFLLALGTFAAILILLLVKPDQLLMKNFATYAFLFLLTGTASLLREAHD